MRSILILTIKSLLIYFSKKCLAQRKHTTLVSSSTHFELNKISNGIILTCCSKNTFQIQNFTMIAVAQQHNTTTTAILITTTTTL